MYPHTYLSDEENIDDFDSDDWAQRLGIRLVDDQRDRIEEEAERDGGYAKDWEFISYQYRSKQGFICEGCGLDCSKHTYLLHTHHIDQNKGHNLEGNLRALCVVCHSAYHPHMAKDLTQEQVNQVLAIRKACIH
jgi:5-methylcytosine-specific restriction endonuclease McrA